MKKVFFSFYLFVITALLLLHFVYSPIVNQIMRRNTPEALLDYNRQLAKRPLQPHSIPWPIAFSS